MANTSDIRNGLCIELNNDLWQVTDFQHVKPGKGNAFVRTKLKSLNTGKTLDHTFQSGHKITTARVENRNFQFLYKDDMGYHFMNQENYEQVQLPENMIDSPEFLKEGQEVDIIYHAETETPLSCELPQFIELQITYSEPGVKGDTATNSTKPATLETGAEVNVPLFVDQDEIIKVDTKSKSYVERVKK